MSTFLRIEPEILPRTMVMKPPLTDVEFEVLCRENGIVRLERTKQGVICMNPPAGGLTSDGNAEIVHQLRVWWHTHKRGRVFGSNAAFRLPDVSTLSPDAAYVSDKRLKGFTREDLKGFPRLCPALVIELLSESDHLKKLQTKMEDWISNGAALAWLIDPYQQQVFVYRQDQEPVRTTNNTIRGEGPAEGFQLDLTEVWAWA